MDINEFAREFKYNGVSVTLDDVSKAFATQWANMVLADYFIAAGIQQIQMGKQLAGIKDDKQRVA